MGLRQRAIDAIQAYMEERFATEGDGVNGAVEEFCKNQANELLKIIDGTIDKVLAEEKSREFLKYGHPARERTVQSDG